MATTQKEKRAQSTVQIAQMVSLLILLVGLFLGSFYWFEGNLFLAIPVAVIVLIAVYYILNHLIGARMERKRSGPQVQAVLLWPLYTVISIMAMFIILHMINVEVYEKKEIQAIGLKKIEGVEKIRKNYEQSYNSYLNSWRAKMDEGINAYNKKQITLSELIEKFEVPPFVGQEILNNGGGNVDQVIDQAILQLKAIFHAKDTLIFGDAEQYVNGHLEVIESWDRFKLNSTMTSLDTDIDRCYSELAAFLLEKTTRKDLEGNVTREGKNLIELGEEYRVSTLIGAPMKLLQKHFGAIHLIFILIIQGLILLPYFMAPKRTFNKRKKKSSEVDRKDDDEVIVID